VSAQVPARFGKREEKLTLADFIVVPSTFVGNIIEVCENKVQNICREGIHVNLWLLQLV
jgi:hypothetical protein